MLSAAPAAVVPLGDLNGLMNFGDFALMAPHLQQFLADLPPTMALLCQLILRAAPA
jgi:hypothetical protein